MATVKSMVKAGVGALANRSQSPLKVASLTLVNPLTGESRTCRAEPLPADFWKNDAPGSKFPFRIEVEK